MEKLMKYLSRIALIAGSGALLSLSSYGATISVTMSLVSPTSGTVIGTTGPLTNYSYSDAGMGSAINSLPVTAFTDINTNGGGGALNFGTLTQSGSNSNVTPTFILGLTPTINSTPASEIYFDGTVDTATNTINFTTCGTDATCAHPATTPLTWYVPNYPTVPESGVSLVYQNVGSYSFGIIGSDPINTSGMKITTLFGFIAPSSVTSAPEPIPAATTGLAIAGLLAFALRRKLLAARN